MIRLQRAIRTWPSIARLPPQAVSIAAERTAKLLYPIDLVENSKDKTKPREFRTIDLTIKMPRFEVHLLTENGYDKFTKYLNIVELTVLVKDRFLNWKEHCVDIFKATRQFSYITKPATSKNDP